jgi:hypothetical protein
MNNEQVKTAFPTERDCMLFLIKKRELKTGSCGRMRMQGKRLKMLWRTSCFVCCCNHFIYPRKTPFWKFQLPLQKWFLGIAYFNQHQKVTGQALSDFLDINYKSAYYMIQKLRKNNLQDFFQ